ncbi:MAG: AAA family ATPase, partial [Cyclobacteriaceae bacterium]|nr:AAA family ATPase [Cyclobacteriaceae bacterium]
ALKTHKNFVIVAPTGIAALNAQGVTIHSQFLFPLGSFIPGRDPSGNYNTTSNFYTQHTLARKHPLNSMRKQVLRATDLLIIDEVSMLRADILDAIDYRMRSVKGNFYQSFGGVQVLMIGDLYQLPPIVKDHEWHVLNTYYKSMHFFEALALKQDGMVYIELDKIFRQQDEKFIGILNNLRNNITTGQDIATLNSYYRSENEINPDEEIITITTHNYKADAINNRELEALPGPSSYYEAEVSGDFPEKLYPLPEKIELKVGAQIMFVKNDSSGEKNYFNGKLARVDYLVPDSITVIMADTNRQFVLRKEEWDNKKYTIDEQSKELDEDVIGSFVQYPIKLAWAVTVHKSQGLTFDKAIIDVGQAFAPGQVYVALSRLRSLDGLILRTRINTSSISSDGNVVTFTQSKEQQKPLQEMLQEQQQNFLQRLLTTTFDFHVIEKQLEYLQKGKTGSMEFEDESMQKAMGIIQGRLEDEKENTAKFRNQLLALLHQNNLEKLLERINKGSAYYGAFMEENLRQLLVHLAEVEQFSRTKTYRNGL